MWKIEQRITDVIVYGDAVIYFDNILQALCKYDLKENCVTLYAEYIDEKAFTVFGICEYDEKIYLTEMNGNILKYDKKIKSFEKISYKPDNEFQTITQQFVFNNKIYMLFQHCTEYPVLVFDLLTEKFEFKNFVKDQINQEKMYLPFANTYDNKFWGVNNGSNTFCRIDPIDETVTLYKLNEDEKLNAICTDGKHFLANTLDSKIILMKTTGESEIFYQTDVESAFSYIVNLEKYMLVLPRFGNRIVLFDKNVCGIYKEFEITDIDKIFGGSNSINAFETEEKIYILPWAMTRIVEIDKNDRTISKIEPQFDRKLLKYYAKKYINMDFNIESEDLTLSEFISII